MNGVVVKFIEQAQQASSTSKLNKQAQQTNTHTQRLDHRRHITEIQDLRRSIYPSFETWWCVVGMLLYSSSTMALCSTVGVDNNHEVFHFNDTYRYVVIIESRVRSCLIFSRRCRLISFLGVTSSHTLLPSRSYFIKACLAKFKSHANFVFCWYLITVKLAGLVLLFAKFRWHGRRGRHSEHNTYHSQEWIQNTKQ